MAGEWSGSGGVLSHGYLVAAISAWLLARSLHNFVATTVSPAWWCLAVVLGLSLTWLLAVVANVAALQSVVLPVLLLAATVTAFGVQSSRTIAFPILYFSFALPAWEHLQFIFQAITVRIVHLLILIADIPVYVEGNYVFLSVGTFEIAGGCSGLSFILAGLSLAVLYGHLYYSTWKQKIILIAATVLVAMIGNWIRVFAIICIGYVSEMQSPIIGDHLTYGWILFSILMIPLAFFARWLEIGSFADQAVPPNATKFAASTEPTRFSLVALLATMLTLAVGPVWALAVVPSDSDRMSVSLLLPDAPQGWVGPSRTVWEWRPEFVGASAERLAEYRSETATVLAYENIYLTQEQGKELIFLFNDIKGNWSLDRDVQMSTLVNAGSAGKFRQLNTRDLNGSWLIWYRYSINGRAVTNDLQGKFMQAIAVLRGSPEAGIIAFASMCKPSCEETQVIMAEFVGALGDGATVSYDIEEPKK